jgi:predicted amidophosphoribosyltransferase
MDIVCKELAQTLNVPYVELFHAWDKRERGRQAHHPDIAVTDDVKDWLGKVVYVLDDVTTTNKTLQAAVGALLALEIHAHAVAWCAYT